MVSTENPTFQAGGYRHISRLAPLLMRDLDTTDLDVMVYSPRENLLVAIEVKWHIQTDGTYEARAHEKEARKRQSRLVKRRDAIRSGTASPCPNCCHNANAFGTLSSKHSISFTNSETISQKPPTWQNPTSNPQRTPRINSARSVPTEGTSAATTTPVPATKAQPTNNQPQG